MAPIVRSLTLSGRNFRWTDYRIHKSACSGHSISWHCFLAETACVCAVVYRLLLRVRSRVRKAERLLSLPEEGHYVSFIMPCEGFFSCCLYSTAMNRASFFLCTVAAAVPYWPRWSLCKHSPALSGRQWGNDRTKGGCIWRHSRMDFQMKHRDDIMAKSASRNMERPGNATPYINSGQLYL